MTTQPLSLRPRSPNLLALVYHWIVAEMHLLWVVIRGDLTATLVPVSLFTITAWQASDQSGLLLLPDMLRAWVYFTGYIAMFCFSNQIVGVEEDRINKPHRPLVTGAMTLEGARIRFWASALLFVALGAINNVLGWTLLWVTATLLHNLVAVARHWTGKHLVMVAGVYAQLGATWQLITPLTPLAWLWISVLAWLLLPLVCIQDLRDMAGDRVVRRSTLPLIWGHWPVRIWLGTLLFLLPVFLWIVLLAPLGLTALTGLWGLAVLALCWTIAARVLLLRNPAADHTTYIMFTCWYCLMLLCSIFVL